jgi:hypothetical protein
MIFVLSFVILAVGPWPSVDKAAKTTIPPLFLRKLRGEVCENVGCETILAVLRWDYVHVNILICYQKDRTQSLNPSE